MKKPTKAKATPTPKAEPEIYYGIELMLDGGIDVISTRNSIEEVECDLHEYVMEEDDGGAEFVIVKQVKGIKLLFNPELVDNPTIRLTEFAGAMEDEE